MPIPLYDPAPSWSSRRSRYIELYHGCTSADKKSIDAGIDLTKCRIDADFGRGFYTTTAEPQARQWAWDRLRNATIPHLPLTRPVVLRFLVDRHLLANLLSISFVLADQSKEFWSLVQHCRRSTPKAIRDHRGPVLLPDGTQWYDVACGPVAAFWRQKFAMQGADQISFHTPNGVGLLTALINSGNKRLYSFEVLLEQGRRHE